MDFSFIKEYFYVILIAITIPIYWLVNSLLKKLKVQSSKVRALLAFIITTMIVIIIGILVALKGFIMFHNIPGS